MNFCGFQNGDHGSDFGSCGFGLRMWGQQWHKYQNI